VLGRTVPIDATLLNSDAFLLLSEAVSFPTATPFTAQLLPGPPCLRGGGGTGGNVAFTVANDGTVSYDPTLEGALTGANTSALGVNGRTVTLNVGALTTPDLFLDEAVFVPVPSVFTGQLLPGVQTLRDGGAGAGGGPVVFTVSNAGTVVYDPSLKGALTGTGTPTLGVVGRTVTIDARALAATSSNLSLDAHSFPTASVFTAQMLPGAHDIAQGPFASVFFTLKNDGTLDFSNALAFSDVLEGRGTSTLTVKGETNHVDARALSASSPTFTLAGIGTFDATQVQSFTLLPGWEQLQVGDLTVDFSAELFDMIDFDPFVNFGIATGRGTDTLTLLPPS
jgi:hypothetical protein